MKTKSSYCRVARQGLPCYTAVARLGFKRRATAVLKSNSIRSIEYGKAVARRLKRASKRGLITPPIRNTSWGSRFQTFFCKKFEERFVFVFGIKCQTILMVMKLSLSLCSTRFELFSNLLTPVFITCSSNSN